MSHPYPRFPALYRQDTTYPWRHDDGVTKSSVNTCDGDSDDASDDDVDDDDADGDGDGDGDGHLV